MFKFFVIFLIYQTVGGNPIYDDDPIEFEDASQLESPWLALIEIYGLRCGGSLIQNRYIVTAAHCFDSLNQEDFDDETKLNSSVIIKLGEWKTDRDPDCDEDIDDQICEPVVLIRPKSIIWHENYDPNRLDNKYESDIAIIELAWPPRNSSLITSIKLPNANECERSVENEKWTVTAFGQIPGRGFTTIKKKIELNMISEEECSDIIKSDDSVFYHKGSHICGKGIRGESTCIGDSGSGVTKKSNDGPVLQGIVSFGATECGTRGSPTGLVKVACFADWIKETIKEFKKYNEDKNESKEKDDTKENNSDDESWEDNNRTLKFKNVAPNSRFMSQHVRQPQQN